MPGDAGITRELDDAKRKAREAAEREKKAFKKFFA